MRYGGRIKLPARSIAPADRDQVREHSDEVAAAAIIRADSYAHSSAAKGRTHTSDRDALGKCEDVVRIVCALYLLKPGKVRPVVGTGEVN